MQGMPPFELVAIRGLAGTLVCAVAAIAMGDGSMLGLAFQPWVMARSTMEIGGNLVYTLAILYMPIADVVSIVLVAPLFTLVGAWALWRERLGGLRLALIAAGLFGAMLVAQPGTTAASPYALLGFLTALMVSSRDLLSRKVPAVVPATVVAMSVMMGMVLAGTTCSLLFETPVLPDVRNGGFAMLAAVFMVLGQMGAYLAFKIEPFRTVAPFMYSIMVWAGLLGYFVFADVPNNLALTGMVIVVAAGLAILMFDKRETEAAPA
jgi:drug/metabolite transporter (DMT)-like permease